MSIDFKTYFNGIHSNGIFTSSINLIVNYHFGKIVFNAVNNLYIMQRYDTSQEVGSTPYQSASASDNDQLSMKALLSVQ